MARDTVETETDLDRLLAGLAALPRNRRLDQARSANSAAIMAVDAAQSAATAHYQRLHRDGANELDRAAKQAEAALIAAQVKHRAALAELNAAREAAAPSLNKHVNEAAVDVRKALVDALATVERIAATLCTVGQAVERDTGSLPSLCRGAYASRAMVRHVAAAIKS